MFDSQVQQVIDKVDQLRHQVDDHWQIKADQALVLAQMLRLARCVSVCEIGVSYGFSTLHLAAAVAPLAGHVHAIDASQKKVKAATEHLSEAGLADHVTVHQGKAQDVLKTLRPDRPFDAVFIDAVKHESFAYLDAVWPLIAGRCVIMTDNTDTHHDELADFVHHLAQLPGSSSCNVPVGNGFNVTLLQRE